VGLMFFSSIFMSIEPRETVKWALQQFLAVLPYFCLRLLITNRKSFQWAFVALLAVGAAVSAYAVFCSYSYVLFGSSLVVGLDQWSWVSTKTCPQYVGCSLNQSCWELMAEIWQ